MKDQRSLTEDKISSVILYIRGEKVILDTDRAQIYGVKTKRLNEQVKRNTDRFPDDFMFRLSDIEMEEVVANCDHLRKLKYSSMNALAFTEHGAIMLSSILNTPSAIETSIFIVRAFIKLRELLSSHEFLERKINELEMRYEENFAIVFKALKELIKEDSKPRKRIGYRSGEI